jgi:polyisoprenoid-binding protein YceI
MPRRFRIGLLLTLVIATALHAQEMTLQLDPANTKIEFTLSATLHTVHGSFILKRGTIDFNPETGSAGGLVVVDTTSANTGNEGRDRKMHKEVLESQRYPEASFTPTKLTGKLDPQGDSEVHVEGSFRLHGSDHPITLTAPVQVKGTAVNIKTHIVVPYVAWGMKNPSTLFLHVGDSVDVDITASGQLTRKEAPAADSH